MRHVGGSFILSAESAITYIYYYSGLQPEFT